MIEKNGTGLLKMVLAGLLIVLSGCATIQPDDQTHTIHAHWMPPAEIDTICPGYDACAIGSDIYIPGKRAERTFSLTWAFNRDFVSMRGNVITGAAWPEEWRLCEAMIENLDLPEMSWRECRLVAHETMHVFGMRHGKPEHKGSAL